jgi:hypothetical protein
VKAYCLDTSGLSTPLENMPEDIHTVLWGRIAKIVVDGKFAVTTEIYEELSHLPGPIGECIQQNQASLQMEIEAGCYTRHHETKENPRRLRP